MSTISQETSRKQTTQSSDIRRYPKRAHAVKAAPEPAPELPPVPAVAPAIDPVARVAAGGYVLVPLEWLNIIMSDSQIREALAKHEALRQHLEWRARAGQETLEPPVAPPRQSVNRATERSMEARAGQAYPRIGRVAATWSLTKGAKEPSSRSESASRIYRYLGEHAGATVRQLMDGLQMPLSTVQNGLRWLQYRGVVIQSVGR